MFFFYSKNLFLFLQTMWWSFAGNLFIGLIVGIAVYYYNKPQQEDDHKEGRNSSTNSIPTQPNDECIICCEQLCPPLEQLPCNHLFHSGCIMKWFQHDFCPTICPICRLQLSDVQIEKYFSRNA